MCLGIIWELPVKFPRSSVFILIRIDTEDGKLTELSEVLFLTIEYPIITSVYQSSYIGKCVTFTQL